MDDWTSVGIGILVIGGIVLVVRGLPVLLVRRGVITAAEPVVSNAMPQARDWALSLLGVLGFVYVIVQPYSAEATIVVGGILYALIVPWWLWRSVKGALYYNQNKARIEVAGIAQLLLTNLFFYGFAGYLLLIVT